MITCFCLPSPPFDVEKFLKAAETLSGTHNFLSFSTKNVLKTGRKITLARLGIHVQRGSGVLEEQRRDMSDIIDVWEVHFHGVSFLYRQVRTVFCLCVRLRLESGRSRVRIGIFPGLSHTSDFKIGTPVATLLGAWRYRVSAGTGWPGVSIL